MQLDSSQIIVTGKLTRALIKVAYEESKILLSIPKTSFKAASIFFARYRLLAKYNFKILYI